MIKVYSVIFNKICTNYMKSCKLPFSNVSSYLYVTGDKARVIYSSVQPHIDFDDRIVNINKLDEDIKRRKIDLDINEMKKVWDFYKTRLEHKQKLELNRKETKLALEKFITNNADGCNDNEIDRLKLRFKLIRDDLKNITKTIWDIENNIIIKVLKVPNELHSKAPDEEENITVFNEKIISGNDHIEIGKHFNCLDYNNKSSYYLKNELALFEVAISQHAINTFKSCGYIPACGTDFGKSVLIEGCTLKNYAPDIAFILQNTDKDKKDNLYLTGSASFIPFYGFHAKQVAVGDNFPIRYIASGRQYNPEPSNNFDGLYSVFQSSAVELFTSTVSKDNVLAEYDKSVSDLIEFYKSLDVHFKAVNVPAYELKPWESLCTSFQLYSPINKAYVEVGNISLIGDFISKRLRAYGTVENNINFLQVISGTVVRIPILIAHLLETSETELHIPKVVKEEMTF